MDSVFVDAGAFIALHDRSDQYHHEASDFYREVERTRIPLLTTNLVFSETCTWLQRRPGFGYPAAVRFGDWVNGVSSPVSASQIPMTRRGRRHMPAEFVDRTRFLTLLFSDSSVEQGAWGFFKRFGASGATYADCVSFAVMMMLGLKRAFTFDGQFADAGFVCLPGNRAGGDRPSS